MLCLPPHTTHVLHPLRKTEFKLIKTYYHQQATDFMHNNSNSAITKFNFGKLFFAAWKKGTTVENAIKGFECKGMHPVVPSGIPEDKFSTLYLLSTRFRRLPVRRRS
jgi:hypothetical protein